MGKVVEGRSLLVDVGIRTHDPQSHGKSTQTTIRSRPYNKRVCVFSSVATSGNVRCQLFISVEDSEAYRFASLEYWNSILS